MSKDIEWLKDKIFLRRKYLAKLLLEGEESTFTERELKTLKGVLGLIDQLDEPEVLSQEWISDNAVVGQYPIGIGHVVPAYKLQSLLVPKQGLPVVPKYVADFIKVRKYTDAYSLQYIFCIAMERSEAEQLKKEYDWISANGEAFARAWLDGYEVEEEPLYFALIKGHELMADEGDWTCNYWNLSIPDGRVFPSDRFSRHDKYLTRMSKSEWNKLGIDESNADFVKVDE